MQKMLKLLYIWKTIVWIFQNNKNKNDLSAPKETLGIEGLTAVWQSEKIY